MKKAIVTKYLPCTGTKGSRIRASDGDGNSVTIPYNHDLPKDDRHLEAAMALCAKMKWKSRLVHGWLKPGKEVFVFID